VPLFCYPGPPGFNVLVSTQGIALEDKNPKPQEGKTRSKEFQPKVREALARFYEKEFKKPIDWSRADKTEKRTVQVQSTKGQPLNLIFEYQTLTDDPDPQKKNQPKDGLAKTKDNYHDFRLYFYQPGKEQAAIIYQIPSTKRNDRETNKGVDFSIRTLVLGVESGKKYQEFAKRRMKR
jgi:hypothetical protein